MIYKVQYSQVFSFVNFSVYIYSYNYSTDQDIVYLQHSRKLLGAPSQRELLFCSQILKSDHLEERKTSVNKHQTPVNDVHGEVFRTNCIYNCNFEVHVKIR